MADDDPAVHCTLVDTVDLLHGLEAAHIEHLEVDRERTIIIYQSAILMMTATDGDVAATREFDVTLWEPPLHGDDRDDSDVLQGFLEEFTRSLPTTRRDN